MMGVRIPDDLRDLKGDFEECLSGGTSYINEWTETGWVGELSLDLVLSYAIKLGASDIHINSEQEISYTILGEIIKQPWFPKPDYHTLSDLVVSMLTHALTRVFDQELELDFSYEIRFGRYKGRRFRVNLGKSLGANNFTFRTINEEIPDMEDLGIEEDIKDMFWNNAGVVLICGPTGSGKSTTLASIMRDIQLKRRLKIITVEKPIEYIYPNDGLAQITQRAIPQDCLSFSNGLTSAMRSAPNIILIGEVRNKEEVDELIRSAETGHLSISTIHTSNNVTTLNRIRSLYEGEEQSRILGTLGDTLRGIVNQILIKSIDGKRRFAVREVLTIDYRIREMIAEGRFKDIRKLQEENCSTLEHQLVDLVISGKCDYKEARHKAPDITFFDEILEQKGGKNVIKRSEVVRSPIQITKKAEEFTKDNFMSMLEDI